jgi:hypothetical protein
LRRSRGSSRGDVVVDHWFYIQWATAPPPPTIAAVEVAMSVEPMSDEY